MLLRSSFLTSLLILPAAVFSYKIDGGCVSKGIDQNIRNAMTSAFSMIDSSLRRLNQDPYDQETADLIIRLFLGKLNQDPYNRDAMAKVRTIFANINRNYQPEVTGDIVPLSDVIIYCDDSRYVDTGKRDGLLRKIYQDTTTGQKLLYGDQMCRGIGDIITLASTYNAKREVWSIPEGSTTSQRTFVTSPTQIQICPWFIDLIKSRRYKLGDEVKRTNLGRFIVNRAEGNMGLRQIDAFNLLDKVLLHEMTHGKSAYRSATIINGKQETIEGIDDVTAPGFAVGNAYGWKRARTLAQKGQDVVGVTNWNLNAPDHNADSLALFASACALLDDTWPRRVTDEGKLEPVGV